MERSGQLPQVVARGFGACEPGNVTAHTRVLARPGQDLATRSCPMRAPDRFLLTVVASTWSPSPAPSAACRAGACPYAAGSTQPM